MFSYLFNILPLILFRIYYLNELKGRENDSEEGSSQTLVSFSLLETDFLQTAIAASQCEGLIANVCLNSSSLLSCCLI